MGTRDGIRKAKGLQTMADQNNKEVSFSVDDNKVSFGDSDDSILSEPAGEQVGIPELELAYEMAEKGIAAAQQAIGIDLYFGQHQDKDPVRAVYWLEKAAQQGLASSQVVLALAYSNGQGVKQDYAKAAYWYEKAAEQGNSTGQTKAGFAYYFGFGVQQDYARAINWLRKGAEQGDVEAQAALARAYYDGEGVERNFDSALYWAEKPAGKGEASAQFIVGAGYANGWSVKKDLETAVKWLEKSAAQGYKPAIQVLPDLREKLDIQRRAEQSRIKKEKEEEEYREAIAGTTAEFFTILAAALFLTGAYFLEKTYGHAIVVQLLAVAATVVGGTCVGMFFFGFWAPLSFLGFMAGLGGSLYIAFHQTDVALAHKGMNVAVVMIGLSLIRIIIKKLIK